MAGRDMYNVMDPVFFKAHVPRAARLVLWYTWGMTSPHPSRSQGLNTTAAIQPLGLTKRTGQSGGPVPVFDSDSHDGQGNAAQDPATLQGLAEELRPLFWDCDFDMLRLKQTPDFIIGRILASGSWNDVGWLRKAAGDATLRRWILQSEGRLLSRKQLRFWELILKLPTDQVSLWLAQTSRGVWDDRTCRCIAAFTPLGNDQRRTTRRHRPAWDACKATIRTWVQQVTG